MNLEKDGVGFPSGVKKVHVPHCALEARLLFCTSLELWQAHVINKEVGVVISVHFRVDLLPVVPCAYYGFEPWIVWT